jgi:hypothetical protein
VEDLEEKHIAVAVSDLKKQVCVFFFFFALTFFIYPIFDSFYPFYFSECLLSVPFMGLGLVWNVGRKGNMNEESLWSWQ